MLVAQWWSFFGRSQPLVNDNQYKGDAFFYPSLHCDIYKEERPFIVVSSRFSLQLINCHEESNEVNRSNILVGIYIQIGNNLNPYPNYQNIIHLRIPTHPFRQGFLQDIFLIIHGSIMNFQQ